MLSEAGFHPNFPPDAVMPADFASMVNRAVHNIFATMRGDARPVDPLTGYTMDRVRYAASSAFATINAPGVQIVPMVTEDCPLDYQTVVVDALLPVIPQERRDGFKMELAEYAARHVKYTMQSPRCRPALPSQDLDWFVGLVLAHPEHGDACIIGWKVRGGPPFCNLDACITQFITRSTRTRRQNFKSSLKTASGICSTSRISLDGVGHLLPLLPTGYLACESKSICLRGSSKMRTSHATMGSGAVSLLSLSCSYNTQMTSRQDFGGQNSN